MKAEKGYPAQERKTENASMLIFFSNDALCLHIVTKTKTQNIARLWFIFKESFLPFPFRKFTLVDIFKPHPPLGKNTPSDVRLNDIERVEAKFASICDTNRSLAFYWLNWIQIGK